MENWYEIIQYILNNLRRVVLDDMINKHTFMWHVWFLYDVGSKRISRDWCGLGERRDSKPSGGDTWPI